MFSRDGQKYLCKSVFCPSLENILHKITKRGNNKNGDFMKKEEKIKEQLKRGLEHY